MTTPSPIAGNQYFAVVQNLAEQVRKLNVSEGKFYSIQSNTTTSGCAVTTGGASSLDGKHLHSVAGYAPTPVAASSSYFLNQLRGQAVQSAPTSSNTSVMTIPAGATIVGVLIEDATVNATVAVGTQALTGIAPTGTVNLAAASTAASVNAGAWAGLSAPAALASAATSIILGSVAVAASPTVTGITITYGTGLTTTSSTAVIVYYLV